MEGDVWFVHRLFTLNVMRKILFAVIGVAVSALIPSCVAVKYTSFERLQGAEVNYPEQVRSVGVVNCAPTVSEWVWSNDVQNSYEGNGYITAESFAQEIAETRYFDQVIICDSTFVPLGADAGSFSMQKDSLIRSLGVDVLFIVEKVGLDMTTDLVWFPEWMQRISVLRVVVTPVIGAYMEGRERPLFKTCKTDTVYWELPLDVELKQVVEDVSEFAATIPMKYLLPYWEEVHRFYFDGGIAEMRDAGIYVREQNWDAAAELWTQIYDKKQGKHKMYAAFNLSLYYEMNDEFEKAKEYLKTAFELSKVDTSERILIQYYYAQLEEQTKKSETLQLQMKRFE